MKNRNPEPCSFDLFRLTKAKKEVDISPNTLRGYAARGLRLYKVGKAVFVSKSELEAFIRMQAGSFVKAEAA